jgi:hypothetical protein
MRPTLTILVISALFIMGLSFSYCGADESASVDSERGVQSLGSRTRAMIMRLSAQGETLIFRFGTKVKVMEHCEMAI